jgi:putative transposase
MGVSTKITQIRTNGGYAMTGNKCKGRRINLQEIFGADKDSFKELLREVLQEVLEQEMTDTLGAGKGERSPGRLGYRSGYYGRALVTRVGKLELRIPQDRQGHFSTQIFERYQRSEKALVSALAEMYIQGVSTRKVKAITEELCGHAFSASAISAVNKTLDESLERFAKRELTETYPYLVLDARYEKVREDGVIRSQAVQIAIGINDEGRRQILAVELANRESQTSWRDVLLELKSRGLRGVEFVVSDDHPGLKRAIAEVIPEAVWQRCYVHFLRNALDHLPRKAVDDCRQELRWLYDRRDLSEAQQDLTQWLERWGTRYPKLCEWVEENIGETFSFYRLPLQHHKHLKSTNMLERFNEEIKRRTRVARIFPNASSCLRLIRALAASSCLRLIRALAVETHEGWLEASRYLNMDLLKEHKKLRISLAA